LKPQPAKQFDKPGSFSFPWNSIPKRAELQTHSSFQAAWFELYNPFPLFRRDACVSRPFALQRQLPSQFLSALLAKFLFLSLAAKPGFVAIPFRHNFLL
jgi:hypothetical protein